MEKLGARRERIAAAVGPCIARASYEVDRAFFERFVADEPGNERFFADGPQGKPHFDLEAYVVARLAAAGIGRVEALALDTYADPDRFYSYRRATHRGEAELRAPDKFDRHRALGHGAPDRRRQACQTRMRSSGPSASRRPKASATSIGNHKLSPATLMMGHGFDPALERRLAEAADLPHLDLRVRDRRARQALLRRHHRQAPGRRRGPGLFALQRPQPGNPRGAAEACGKTPRTR